MANPSMFQVVAGTDPESVPALIMGNSGGYMMPGPAGFDSRVAHAAEIGASGGIANARSLARMYAPLGNGGELNGVQLLAKPALARMSTPASVGSDAAMKAISRFTLGYIKSHDNRRQPPMLTDSAILSADAFGHPGFGGSIGFASPANRVSFAYTMNKMGVSTLLDARGQVWWTRCTGRWATATTQLRASPADSSWHRRVRLRRVFRTPSAERAPGSGDCSTRASRATVALGSDPGGQ